MTLWVYDLFAFSFSFLFATISRAVKDALDEYKTTELFKAMDQAETAEQVTSCDNP